MMVSLKSGETATEARRYVATGTTATDAGLFATIEIYEGPELRGTVQIVRKPMQKAMRAGHLVRLADAAFTALEAEYGPQDQDDTEHPIMGGF